MRDPFTAGILSFLIPGLGQLYNGRILAGILWLIITPGLWIGSGGTLGWICHRLLIRKRSSGSIERFQIKAASLLKRKLAACALRPHSGQVRRLISIQTPIHLLSIPPCQRDTNTSLNSPEELL
jgi:hypothetical protein